jgi:3-hydroxyisobutyrate dehydrogenase
MHVGYVGLGAMGGALARRLISDYSLVVWDSNKNAVDALVKLGASTADSLAGVARKCDLVILCLPDRSSRPPDQSRRHLG